MEISQKTFRFLKDLEAKPSVATGPGAAVWVMEVTDGILPLIRGLSKK